VSDFWLLPSAASAACC